MTNDPLTLDEPLITDQEWKEFTMEQMVARLNVYRKHILQGEEYKLSQNAYRNSVMLLRQSRLRAIQTNPRATKAAKAAAKKTIAPLDLGAL